ncbi:MAG: MauE/DoxX family redox-associated membrane protein [Pirellulales bacterium]
MRYVKTILKWLLGVFFVGAGVLHFVNEGFYLKIMPDYIPAELHRTAVVVSGVFEVLFGAMLMVGRTTRLAAWGIIALLIAVFPANIHVYLHQELIPEAGPRAHLLRLPLQGVFIAWAYWYTRPEKRVGRLPSIGVHSL